jgi:pyruvate/2-oxoglutarate dehydrogenase complex dihydrolipoamide acyltransferase (E2) component
MEHCPTRRTGFVLVGICALALSTGVEIRAVGAQDTTGARPSAPAASTGLKPMYYVDFRARTAASYGHAFVWYGRSGQRKVDVAGLHPATESVVPYIVGHIIPVLSETGKSYGDLDEQYLEASYRVFMDEAQARRVFAYIKRLQSSRPLWNAALYNCVSFIQDIAREMGLRVPGNHLLYPKNWVEQLRALNGGAKYGIMPGAARAALAPAPAAEAPVAAAPAQAAAAPAPAQATAARRPRAAAAPSRAAVAPSDRLSAVH